MAVPTFSVDGYGFPEGLWYQREEHLWLNPSEPDGAGRREIIVGVDAIGVQALGDVVYVQLLDPGQSVLRGQAIGSLEAEKMVRPLVAPVSGSLLEANGEILAAPRLLNTDPYGRGWLVRIRASRWDAESRDLLRGAPAIEEWVRAELKAHEEERS
ncbi:MAG: hypothetical protein HYR50_16240 [Candidatus Rokubacteria bacterium]|nr:hypothetical protein [Candidatus Rokubacteria bacterium]HLF48657.1 hypothetical protein [Methylomirabilota bacterium]